MPRTTRVALLDDVRAERLDLAAVLEALPEADWDRPTLCAEWVARDVVAHLTLSTRQTVPATIWRTLRAGGNFERAEARWAKARAAAFSPAELIARPLGIERPIQPDRAVPALAHVWDRGVYGRAAKRFAGLRFGADDADWSSGDGPRIEGSAADLLMIATGRWSAFAGLRGPGLDEARSRVPAGADLRIA